MVRPRGPYDHVLRVSGLFAGGFLAFLIVRSALIPSDFGVHGFYRAGALADNANRPIAYAGDPACVECHDVADAARRGNRHEKVRCEACHGPMAKHAEDFAVKSPRLEQPSLCMGCHLTLRGKPDEFPQVVLADHFEGSPCTECHDPHRPRDETAKEP